MSNPITQINKLHPLWGVYHWLLTFSTRSYVRFTNTTVSSLLDGRPINAWREIFLQVTSPIIPGRAEVLWDKYLHTYVVYFYSGRLYSVQRFGDANVELQKNLWWRCWSRQHVQIYNFIWQISLQSHLYRTKLYFERIGHLYDIDIVD